MDLWEYISEWNPLYCYISSFFFNNWSISLATIHRTDYYFCLSDCTLIVGFFTTTLPIQAQNGFFSGEGNPVSYFIKTYLQNDVKMNYTMTEQVIYVLDIFADSIVMILFKTFSCMIPPPDFIV